MPETEIRALGLNEANILNNMAIQELYNKSITNRFIFPECQRQGKAWTPEKKRRLIDSILRGYQLPAFFFRQYDEAGQDKFIVYDGQQRIETITQFIKGELALKSSSSFKLEPIRFSDNKVQRFDEPVYYIGLIDEAVNKILNTWVYYYKLPALNDQFLDEVFLRLQEGQTLSGVEKRRSKSTHPIVIKIKEIVPLIDQNIAKNFCFEFLSGRAISYSLSEQALNLIYGLEEEEGNRGITTTELKELYKKDVTKAYISKTQKVIRKMISIFNSTDLLEKGDKKFVSNKFIPFFLVVIKLEESNLKSKEKEIREGFLKFLHELDKITLAMKNDENADLRHFDKRAKDYYLASQEKGTDQIKNIKIRYENMYNFIATYVQAASP